MANNNFEIPTWAGKPPGGLHLDVLKDGKMAQKLMIDEKKCYFFGRNRDLCDFAIDHASCSRVHAVLIWHKDLNRSFLIDLGSTHGTFVGPVELESHKPQQLFTGTQFHFGASTRIYVIREKPQVQCALQDSEATSLPSQEMELDNLTEFNTAHNRRVVLIAKNSSVVNAQITEKPINKRVRKNVNFNEEEIIINPEDTDPTVGRFRNLVHSTIIISHTKKRPLNIHHRKLKSSGTITNHLTNSRPPLHAYLNVASKLGIPLPNLAPDLHQLEAKTSATVSLYMGISNADADDENDTDDKKPRKKYMKEAWPGKKPALYV